ncbi:MAG: hypothetical protein ACRCYO_13340 [Bacteroidia bacterium]
MAYLNGLDPILEIQRTGKYGGKDALAFNINGRRESFTSTSAFNDVGDAIGISGVAIFPVLNGTETIQVISSSASDDGSPLGIGIQTVRITYINTSFQLVETPDIVMNGTTAVNVVVGGMLQVLWIEATNIGSTGTAVGNITLRTSTLVNLSVIRIGTTKSQDAIFMVPDGFNAYINIWSVENIANSQDYRIRANVNSFDRTISNVFKVQDNQNNPSNSQNNSYLNWLKYPPRSRIKVSTISSSTAAATRACVNFLVVLIKI